MAIPIDSQSEQPRTPVVQEHFSQEELVRLQIQDQMITTGMGGALPEQVDSEDFAWVLDIGCGTAGWLIELAKTDPAAAQLVGVDSNGSVLEYARTQADVQAVGDLLEFREMDVLAKLDFPRDFFDLVNMRCGVKWLHTSDWPGLLQEYKRVARPGGTVRITESDMLVERSSSPALTRLNELFLDALYRADHLFSPDRAGILSHLPGLLEQQGIKNVQTRAYALEYRAATPSGQLFCANMAHDLQTGLPFLQKWTDVPTNYDELYQQALQEMQQPDFVACWNLLTVWGTV
jgi:SAM-dependent methyltransferase